MGSMRLDVGQAADGMKAIALRRLMTAILSDVTASSGMGRTTNLINGGLAIKAGGSVLAKTVNTVYGFVAGVLFTKAAADCAALVGTVSNAAFNVFVFSCQVDGTMVTTMGTEGASLAAVAFPAIPTDAAVLGFVVINPTGTGDFVGGTTDLDDATVVPTAAYVDTPFPFNPVTVQALTS